MKRLERIAKAVCYVARTSLSELRSAKGKRQSFLAKMVFAKISKDYGVPTAMTSAYLGVTISHINKMALKYDKYYAVNSTFRDLAQAIADELVDDAEQELNDLTNNHQS